MALVYEYMSEGALHEHLRSMKITRFVHTLNIIYRLEVTNMKKLSASYLSDDLLQGERTMQGV